MVGFATFGSLDDRPLSSSKIMQVAKHTSMAPGEMNHRFAGSFTLGGRIVIQ